MTPIPFFRHDLGEAEVRSFAEALRGTILTTGDFVAQFERRFADTLGAPHAVGVGSCTAALQLALQGLGIGPGDEVITTPMTFVATAAAVLQVGARPVFADVDPRTGNLDVTQIEPAIGPCTRAIVPVHLYGQMCDMAAIRAVADRHGLKVIEDAAHCVEGRRGGIAPGQLSDAACFSFYATKSLTSGEGGALVTRSAELAERVRQLRLHGLTSGAAERERHGYRHWDMVELGWKHNMDNLRAAVLLPQLERLAANHRRRAECARRYLERLRDLPGVVVPHVEAGVEHAWHMFAVRIEGRDRDGVLAALQEMQVGVTVNYLPVHLTSYFRRTFGCRPGSHPAAERIGATTLSLPLYAAMPAEHVDEVARRLGEVMRES